MEDKPLIFFSNPSKEWLDIMDREGINVIYEVPKNRNMMVSLEDCRAAEAVDEMDYHTGKRTAQWKRERSPFRGRK